MFRSNFGWLGISGWLATCLIFSAPLIGADLVGVQIDSVKQEYSAAAKSARAKLLVEFVSAEEHLNESKKPIAEKVDELKKLRAEQETYISSWFVPKSTWMTTATKAYKEDLKAARKTAESNFEKIAVECDERKDLDSAARVLAEKGLYQIRMAAIDDPRWMNIYCFATKKVIGVADASKENGTRLVQWEHLKSPEMCWQLVPIEDEWFKIRNRNSGLVIAIGGGAKADRTRVIQWESADAPDQQWKLELIEDKKGLKTVVFRNRNSGMVLSLEYLEAHNGVVLIQTNSIPDSKYQSWQLVTVP